MPWPSFEIDARTLFLVLVFAAVFSAAQFVWSLARVGVSKRAVNRRLAVAERTASLGELVIELRKQRGMKDNGERRNSWLSDLILTSGVPYRPRQWAMVIGALGLIGAAASFVLTRNPVAAPLAGVGLAGLAPFAYLKFMAGRRSKALGVQLPNALEVVVRSLEAGHPVPTAISLVGRELPDPIGSEFGMAADEVAYGATLEQAIGHMAERCRHPDIDLFAATIRMQERAGGNLMGLLKINAHTVRERHKMRLKIHAASAEGRASAMILTAAPFCVFGLLQVLRPSFYGSVMHEPSVRMGLIGFGIWMFIGNIVIRRMIDMRI